MLRKGCFPLGVSGERRALTCSCARGALDCVPFEHVHGRPFATIQYTWNVLSTFGVVSRFDGPCGRVHSFAVPRHLWTICHAFVSRTKQIRCFRLLSEAPLRLRGSVRVYRRKHG
ncbi:unnamed protein product [Scytosiphon promiscuus]